ncbi:hypothetical protein QW71_15465 [Paenibacillus sp. IHB B 3415]|jgi:hypothetical protein|uniref:CLC_0170 family protein n=1 Tax=Paenibacillus sp. IHB B 3415 TaxID=867080 RepID=UPI0005751E9C|nr:CLC_0170 family protein [Paenibacillus sp. IHB B 3415]KHL94923.1 hypothetical protein QW71_15465 [Paenibacillus sp. IHB B 3415]
MVRLFGSLVIVLLVSTLMLLAIDARIYNSRGWLREKKYAMVLGWAYSVISLAILIGLIIYV